MKTRTEPQLAGAAVLAVAAVRLANRFSKEFGLPSTCGMILCCILVAGLWPFRRPQNQVSWFQSGKGLSFGQNSIVISQSTLRTTPSEADEACTLEIWLQPSPARNDKTILTFHAPENPRQFSLSMWEGGLVLRREGRTGRHKITINEAFVADAFRDGKSVFISVTSDGHKTTVYLDGTRVVPNRDFVFSARDLTGRLVIGPSPESNDGWHGRLLGLGIYRRNLTAAEAFRDYEIWTKGKHSGTVEDDSSVAIYRFDEHRGTVAHDSSNRGFDLHMPERFVLLDQPMLRRPGEEFRWTWGYWRNVAINIAGFVPLGFFFCALLSQRRRTAPGLTSVLIGATTSLTIEILQAYLPTRNSGVTDLLTNTFGTSVGVVLYIGVREWLSIAGAFTRDKHQRAHRAAH